MTDTGQVNALGRLVRSHRVNTGRRLGQGIGLTITGALVILIAIPIDVAYVGDATTPGYSLLPGLLTGLGVVLVGIGVIRLVQGVLRPGERFDIHERGFAHITDRGTRTVPWPQVASIRELGRYRDGGLWHSLGLDYRCIVQLQDGTRIRFNTLTGDTDILARAIGKNRS